MSATDTKTTSEREQEQQKDNERFAKVDALVDSAIDYLWKFRRKTVAEVQGNNTDTDNLIFCCATALLDIALSKRDDVSLALQRKDHDPFLPLMQQMAGVFGGDAAAGFQAWARRFTEEEAERNSGNETKASMAED